MQQECHVILVEYHTHDVYVDFDQLSEYERFGGPPFVLFEYVDVEVTAFNPVASHFVLFVKKSFTTYINCSSFTLFNNVLILIIFNVVGKTCK